MLLLWIVLLVTLDIGVCCAAMSVLCSLVDTCWERADLLAVVFVVFCHFPKCVLVHIRIKGEFGAVNWFKPSSKYFTDRSKAVLLLWMFYVLSILCLLCLFVRLFICALWSPAGKGLTSWLSFVVSNYEFVTFPSVSWVRCGTWLYRLLIFAPLLTFVVVWP